MSWKYFSLSDFACKHCGQNLMDPQFINKLDWLREEYKHPLVVSSGYRCPVHNMAVSTTGPNGPHTTGHAVDFLINRGAALELLKVALDSSRFTGVGLNQKGTDRFIHFDDLPNALAQPRPTIWTY